MLYYGHLKHQSLCESETPVYLPRYGVSFCLILHKTWYNRDVKRDALGGAPMKSRLKNGGNYKQLKAASTRQS